MASPIAAIALVALLIGSCVVVAVVVTNQPIEEEPYNPSGGGGGGDWGDDPFADDSPSPTPDASPEPDPTYHVNDPVALDPVGWGYAQPADFIIASRTSANGTVYYGCYNTTSARWINSWTSTNASDVFEQAYDSFPTPRNYSAVVKAVGVISLTNPIVVPMYATLEGPAVINQTVYGQDNIQTSIGAYMTTIKDLTLIGSYGGAGIRVQENYIVPTTTNDWGDCFITISGISQKLQENGLYCAGRKVVLEDCRFNTNIGSGVVDVRASSDTVFRDVYSGFNHRYGYECIAPSMAYQSFWHCVANSNGMGGYYFGSGNSHFQIHSGYVELNTGSGITCYNTTYGEIDGVDILANIGVGVNITDSSYMNIHDNYVSNNQYDTQTYPIYEVGSKSFNNSYAQNKVINNNNPAFLQLNNGNYYAGNFGFSSPTGSSFGNETIAATPYNLGTPSHYWACIYQASATGLLHNVGVYLSLGNNPQNVQFAVYDADTGANLGNSTVSTPYSSYTLGFITCNFTYPISVIAGHNYAIAWRTDVSNAALTQCFASIGSADQLWVSGTNTFGSTLNGATGKFALQATLYANITST